MIKFRWPVGKTYVRALKMTSLHVGSHVSTEYVLINRLNTSEELSSRNGR